MYNEGEFLLLSGIQHFSFCRRQWALIHVEQAWEENYLTAEGRIRHNRVHDENVSTIRDGVITMRGMRVKSSSLGISGECDAVEFHQCEEDGIYLHNREGMWLPMPVEYKRGSPKIGDCDRLQVCAQVLCLEEMFSCHIDQGCIFYFETRKRELVEITHSLRNEVVEMLEEMHGYMRKQHTPIVKTSTACSRCSLNNICMPSVMNKHETVSDYINRHLEETAYEENA